MNTKEEIEIIDVTQNNVAEIGFFCIKDKKSPGYALKVDWFKSKINHGLKIKIAVDINGKQIGFIEYIPSELAWRPIKAKNYLYIQCIVIFAKKTREQGIGSLLIQHCKKDAKAMKKSGICTVSSDGSWMASKSLFEKNDFEIADQLDRFELMIKPFNTQTVKPSFIDWTKEQSKYKGWNLVYSDQCPWNEKSINDLKQSALDNGIELNVKKFKSPKEAQNGPSGYGTFGLIKDGKLIEDHYISRTRFENILKMENKLQPTKNKQH